MNAGARSVYRAPRFCHITALLRELHLSPVKLRIDFKILIITFKILQGLAPSYLYNLISILLASYYQLRRNNSGLLLENPRFRTKKTMADRSFMVAAPVLWNNFPLPIRQAKNTASFKGLVNKTFLSQNTCLYVTDQIYIYIVFKYLYL